MSESGDLAEGVRAITLTNPTRGNDMKKIMLFVLIGLFVVGCASTPLKVPMPKAAIEKNYEVLGPTEATSCGFMFLQFIPLNQNGRFVDAYWEAVKSQGGDFLIDPEISEHWYWIYIGNFYCFKVKGTAVKAK
jgi:hypothetical protein